MQPAPAQPAPKESRPADSAAIALEPAGDTRIGPGDEFDPARLRVVYVLANRGAESSLVWEASVSQPWLTLAGANSGVLDPGESVEVPVTISPDLANPGVDPAAADVLFRESGTGTPLATRGVTVQSSFASVGSDGWTTFSPSADTRVIYVSRSDGSDQEDGLSPSTPKRTLGAGIALLRHGYPDWLLLKRGDVWHESLGQWKKGGRSENEPMLISTYGDDPARPLLRTGGSGGIWTNGGGGTPATIEDLALVGVHFQADGYSGGGDCTGAKLLQPSSHILIEDCTFEGYGVNVVFQGFGGRHSDFRLRRSVIVDSYAVHSIGGHSQGLYAYAVDGLLIEENVFDHNGWREAMPGAGADIYSHNVYVDNDNTDVVVRGNIIANASSHGMQIRPGGSVINNLFVRNSIALHVGGGNNPEPGGVTADVRGNVILDGKDIDANQPRGWGMWFANISSGRVTYNVIANNTLGRQPSVISLDGQFMGDSSPTVGIHDLEIEKNVIFNWGGCIQVGGNSSQISDITLADNDVQNSNWATSLIEFTAASATPAVHSSGNRFFCQLLPASDWTAIEHTPHPINYWFSLVGDATSAAEQVVYRDPTRSVASYNALLGGAASVDAFLAEARQQSSRNWRPDYTAARTNRYIRGGF